MTEATTPLACLPYREQVQKKQKEVVLLLQQLEEVSSHLYEMIYSESGDDFNEFWIKEKVLDPTGSDTNYF